MDLMFCQPIENSQTLPSFDSQRNHYFEVDKTFSRAILKTYPSDFVV